MDNSGTQSKYKSLIESANKMQETVNQRYEKYVSQIQALAKELNELPNKKNHSKKYIADKQRELQSKIEKAHSSAQASMDKVIDRLNEMIADRLEKLAKSNERENKAQASATGAISGTPVTPSPSLRIPSLRLPYIDIPYPELTIV